MKQVVDINVAVANMVMKSKVDLSEEVTDYVRGFLRNIITGNFKIEVVKLEVLASNHVMMYITFKNHFYPNEKIDCEFSYENGTTVDLKAPSLPIRERLRNLASWNSCTHRPTCFCCNKTIMQEDGKHSFTVYTSFFKPQQVKLCKVCCIVESCYECNVVYG